jgi:hypothetical protein
MSVIGADGLRLWIGNGATSEVFESLDGVSISRFEINQRGQTATAVASSAWQEIVGTINRQASIDVDGYAVESSAADRVRALAVTGAQGNFRLALSTSETMIFAAAVIQYREDSGAGDIKRLRFRLESSGAPLLT